MIPGIVQSQLVPVEIDPYFSSVELLLHFEGSNGSTTFIDSSSKNRTVTPSGGAQLTTASPIIGSSSGEFDGSGDYIETADDDVFDLTGDFTLQVKLKGDDFTSVRPLCSKRDNATVGEDVIQTGWSLVINASGVPRFYAYNNVDATGVELGSGSLSEGVEYEIAVEREGDVWRLYIDGVVDDSATASFTAGTNSQALYIAAEPFGGGSPSRFFDGLLDEFRFTSGVARFGGSAYTPSGEPFPGQ